MQLHLISLQAYVSASAGVQPSLESHAGSMLAQDVFPFLQLSESRFWPPEKFAGTALALLLNLFPSPEGCIRML